LKCFLTLCVPHILAMLRIAPCSSQPAIADRCRSAAHEASIHKRWPHPTELPGPIGLLRLLMLRCKPISHSVTYLRKLHRSIRLAPRLSCAHDAQSSAGFGRRFSVRLVKKDPRIARCLPNEARIKPGCGLLVKRLGKAQLSGGT